jgi:putative FmdB family regulatory protein
LKIFNYQCLNNSCNNFFEKFVSTSDEVVVCPKCDHTTEKRLTMPAFILKGVGCYSNGTYAKAKDGPVLDKELLALDDVSLNRELGLPDDCA